MPALSDLFKGAGAEFLPDQKALGSKIISEAHINDSLLILANLTSSMTNESKFVGSTTSRDIRRYIYGMKNRDDTVHHYGLVRMLAWLPDDAKSAFLPRTITERKKFSVRLDLTAQVIEIAGGVPQPGPRPQARRQHDLAVQSEQLVAQRAKEFGVWDPKNRRPLPSSPPWYEIGLVADALDRLRKLPPHLSWQTEMLALEDAWNEGQEQVQNESSAKERGSGIPLSRELQKLRLLRTKFLTMRKAKIVPQEWANRQNDIDKAERELFSRGQVQSALAASREDIQKKAAILHAEMDKGRKDLALLARKYIDDRRGFDQQPPLLQWDRRTSEPLVVKNDEFYPAKKMALLDFKPAPEHLDRLSDFDTRTCFDYILSTLFRNPAQSVRNHLMTIVQGGLEEFMERVPDLSNISKGGNLDLDDLRIRTVPIELLVQLALALETWPFRMETHEMIMATGRKKSSVLLDDK